MLITDNRVRQAMVPYYHIDNDFCKAKSIDSDHDWFIIYYLSN